MQNRTNSVFLRNNYDLKGIIHVFGYAVLHMYVNFTYIVHGYLTEADSKATLNIIYIYRMNPPEAVDITLRKQRENKLFFFSDPTPIATCTGAGDPHFVNLDRQRFDYQGDCTYILSETIDKNLPRNVQPFKARLSCKKLFPAHRVTFSTEMYINVYGMDIRMTLKGLFVSIVYHI